MSGNLSRHNLPRGWSLARWDAAKGEVRSVIWRQGLSGKPGTYKELSGQLESERLFWRSPILRALLDEIALDVASEGGPWVTALVTRSGSPCPGAGFFITVPESQWLPSGKAAFCREQQQLAARWIAAHPDGKRRS